MHACVTGCWMMLSLGWNKEVLMCYQIIETANKSHQCLPQGWEGTEIILLLPTNIPASPLFKIKCPSVLILQGRGVGVSGHSNHSPPA